MRTYAFVLDQPGHQDLDGPHYVVSQGDTLQDAEVQARDHLQKTTGTLHGFRRVLVCGGAPLTRPDADSGTWHDARPRPSS
ncbi:MAG TPA: hypothetical protein VIU15_38930 [Streptomyces sp.]